MRFSFTAETVQEMRAFAEVLHRDGQILCLEASIEAEPLPKDETGATNVRLAKAGASDARHQYFT
jgi:hypothetical protein